MADAAKPDIKDENAFAGTQSVYSSLMGGLAIFALVAKAWEGGLAKPVQLFLDTYNAILNFLFGWAQPYLHAFAETLGAWSGFDLHLYPQWKASVVAYGILVGAGLSVWGELKFPSVSRRLIRILAGAVGITVGLIDAILQRDLQPGESFYGLWQIIGQNYLLVLTFAIAVMLTLLGLIARNATQSFLSARDAELCWVAGKRTLQIYAAAAVIALLAAGGKLLDA